ncbi:MAG: hypothetical protein LBQ19_03180 [Synergistaceae bacterium]|jgi:hypothetical protein|nr:hypothetical protein [Synergistaceae bacterium]
MIGLSSIKKFSILSALFLLALCGYAHAAVDFAPDTPALQGGFGGEVLLRASYARLEGERFKTLGNPYLIWESDATPQGGLRLMLVCGKIATSASSGLYDTMGNVRLLLVRERADGAIELARQVKLGDGAFPELLAPGSDGGRGISDFMVRIIRSGNNTEAFAYFLDADSAKLTETLRVNRLFPVKIGVRLRGKLTEGGFAEVVSVSPDKTARVDLSEAMDALVEDGLYQLNARPIPSMSSLSCVRNGWEGEEFSMGADGPELRVGLSLVTPSRKQVVNATAVLSKNSGGKWAVTDYTFEPFLPYRSW